MTAKVAHRNLSSLRSVRAGYCCSIAALFVFFGSQNLQNARADGETRTISFHHIHTDEELTVTYKVNGRYDDEALRKIDNLLRDWRESQVTRIDPHLIDLLWEVHREVGAKEAIWIVCGYRSPETNAMLRRRSSGVAQFSQHMLGKAIDFYIPGVSLEQLREAGLRAQRGGVGFYPTSGAPFVHMDTGSVRHWPRMPEAQLASVLSKGQLHSASASDGAQRSRMPGLLARLFGGGRDEAQDAATAAAPAPVKVAAISRKPAAAPEARSEKPSAVAESRIEKVAMVPFPPAKPAKQAEQFASAAVKPAAKPAQTYEVASAASEPVPIPAGYEGALRAASAVARANISANDVINERGYWQGLPSAEPADAPQVARAAPPATPRRAIASAAATPWPLTERSDSEPMSALAYAAQPTPIAVARALPTDSGTPRVTPAAPPETTIAVKNSDDRPSVAPPKGPSVVRVGDRFNDPWMRAMIVSPSAQAFMKTTVYGVPDFRALGPYLLKPTSTMMATFSEDPYRGMTSESFAGSAVGFTRTVTFGPPRTAALR
ncbi:MAG TPA: DUF882 domain-containing protein [Xanthobacteraceae bacterium]|nr:DUF882 domain-containing protein [Xanthobacteraceae bacterium]